MKLKIKIWHLIAFIWLLLLVFRFDVISNFFLLWIKYVELFFNDMNFAIKVLDFQTLDSLLSFKMIIVIPVVLIIFQKKLPFLKQGLNFAYSVIVILILTFLLAPVIAYENPEFQKNLNVTKLLEPLSSIKALHLKTDDNLQASVQEKFIIARTELLKMPFNEKIIFADSVKLNNDVIYYQKRKSFTISKDEVLFREGKPFVTNRLFLLGTDEFGRDIFARLIYGLRVSLLVGFGSAVLSLLIGLTTGFIAGYKGSFLSTILSRLTDLFLVFPIIYLVVLILALFGSSLLSVIFVLGITGWMSLFKIVKSEVIALKQKDFIITAGLVGLSKTHILLKEVLPVILAPVMVNLVFQFSNVVLAESALSYLGLGTAGGYPSWGSMIEAGQEYITKAWWMMIFPGACLIITLLSINDAGRKLNKLVNPRLNA